MKNVKLLINFDNFDSILRDIGYFSNDKKFSNDVIEFSSRKIDGFREENKKLLRVNICKWRNFLKYRLYVNAPYDEIIYTFICQKQKEKGLSMSKFHHLFIWPDQIENNTKKELVI